MTSTKPGVDVVPDMEMSSTPGKFYTINYPAFKLFLTFHVKNTNGFFPPLNSGLKYIIFYLFPSIVESVASTDSAALPVR